MGWPPWSMTRGARGTGLRPAFTLLETVMAVAIFALLMVALGNLWTVCWRATERIAHHDQAGFRADLVSQRLTEAVEASVFHPKPKSLYAWQGNDEPGRRNESDSISFVTTLAPDAAAASTETGAPERIRIHLRDEGGGRRRLIMQAAPFTMVEESDWQRETVLLENVTSFRVRYWNGFNKQWEDGWRNEEQPPAAIQFAIAMPGETRTDASVWDHAWTARVRCPVDVAKAVSAAQPGESGGKKETQPEDQDEKK